MTRILKTAGLALALSFVAGAALACGPDGCGKDKDGKMECCCDKMKDGHAAPDASKPPAPQPKDHEDHKH